MITIPIPPVYFWLAVLIICLVVEAVTTQLVTIWFAAGSIGALFAAKANLSHAMQLAVFLVLSFAFLLAFRPFVRKILRPKQDRTNADRILGQNAVVIQTIDNQAETGQIRLMGQIWSARSVQENEIIESGETVVVQKISGVKAIVTRGQATN